MTFEAKLKLTAKHAKNRKGPQRREVNGKQKTVSSERFLTVPLLTAHCSLPSAYCLLPTAYCLRFLRLAFAFTFSTALTLAARLGRLLLLPLMFRRRLRLLFHLMLLNLWGRRRSTHLRLRALNLGLRLVLRRIAYSLSLRLLLSLALGLLLSASPLDLSTSLFSQLLLLSTNIFSLLLLKLPRLALSLSITSGGLGAKPFYLLFACLVYLPQISAIIIGFPVIFDLELAIPVLVGNTLHAHSLRQVLPKLRLAYIPADKNRRVPEFLRNPRRQIDLAASPCGMDHRVSKRSQC
jgi:hypothetical protein